MSVKTTITNNSTTSAVVGGKTLTRRTEGGQVIYDGSVDSAGVIIGDAPPASPEAGDLWFDEGAASLYVYVASPTNAWIQANPAGGSIGVATTSEDGLMSSGDKTKLDEMPTGGDSGIPGGLHAGAVSGFGKFTAIQISAGSSAATPTITYYITMDNGNKYTFAVTGNNYVGPKLY
jgi:hypothetical protein